MHIYGKLNKIKQMEPHFRNLKLLTHYLHVVVPALSVSPRLFSLFILLQPHWPFSFSSASNSFLHQDFALAVPPSFWNAPPALVRHLSSYSFFSLRIFSERHSISPYVTSFPMLHSHDTFTCVPCTNVSQSFPI